MEVKMKLRREKSQKCISRKEGRVFQQSLVIVKTL